MPPPQTGDKNLKLAYLIIEYLRIRYKAQKIAIGCDKFINYTHGRLRLFFFVYKLHTWKVAVRGDAPFTLRGRDSKQNKTIQLPGTFVYAMRLKNCKLVEANLQTPEKIAILTILRALIRRRGGGKKVKISIYNYRLLLRKL